MFEVEISSMSPKRFRSVLTAERFEAFEPGIRDARELLAGRVVWNINSTARGLVYAGPAVAACADDPEAAQGPAGGQEAAQSLPGRARRRRIHLASLPMDDPAENAIIVNALQRHVNVIVQKSLAEGFGLTVAEAMWKARPVVASGIGGIQSQIIDGESGILLDDPRDLRAFGEAVTGLLLDSERG